MKLSHIALATSALLALNGCLKVKDNNDSELVAKAIDNQTATQQQNAAEAQKKQLLTLSGLVRGFKDSVDLSNAQVRLLIGNTLSEPVKVVDGAYTLTNVPKNSNVILIVENKEKNVNFVTELYAFRTTSGETLNTVQQLPLITVAKPVTHKFQVLNVKDNKPIELKEVYATTIATDKTFKLDTYLLKATYDKTLAEYSIVLPENFSGSIVADLDVDLDNNQDFSHLANSNMNFNTLFTATTLKNGYVYLEPTTPAYQEFTIQLKLAERETGELLTVPYVIVNNGTQAIIRATRIAETGYYQAKTRYYGNNFSITIPQFDTDTKRYTTKNYQLYQNTNGSFSVYGDQNFSTALNNGVLELTLPVAGVLKSSTIELATVLKTVNQQNNLATLFFNLPVEFGSNAFSLVTEGDVVVTSSAGTTRVTAAPALTLPFSMLYNDTAAQVNLAAALKTGYQQTLYLNQSSGRGNALNKLSGVRNTLTETITLPVKVPSTEFKPTDIVVDNKNFSTAGVLLNPTNSAGTADPVTPNQANYRLALLIPESALTLENLQVKLSYQGRTLWQNSYMPTPSSYRTILALPSNEGLNIETNAVLEQYSMQGLTTAGRYIHTSIDTYPAYIKDDTATETVKVQLEYSYTTKAGVQQSGTVELPVR